MKHPPLWLPEGSVRSIIALGAVGGLIAAVFLDVDKEGLAILSGIASSAMTFYFKGRFDAQQPR